MANRTCSLDGCERAHRARGYCSTHYNQIVCGPEKRHKRMPTPCEVCGTVVPRRDDDRYQHVCSTSCRTILAYGQARRGSVYNWALDAARRAARAGAEVREIFTREEIFARDDLTCYLCGERCDPSVDPLAARYPTVDHVVALVNGGEHSRANARTACYGCNSAKGDRELLLIG